MWSLRPATPATGLARAQPKGPSDLSLELEVDTMGSVVEARFESLHVL